MTAAEVQARRLEPTPVCVLTRRAGELVGLPPEYDPGFGDPADLSLEGLSMDEHDAAALALELV